MGRSLEGQVRDEKGTPLSGVRVYAWGAGRKLLSSAKTGKGGRFSLLLPAKEEAVLLFFSAPGYLPKRIDLRGGKGAGSETDAVLKRGRQSRLFLVQSPGRAPWTRRTKVWIFGVLWVPPGWGPLAKDDPLAPPQEALCEGGGEFRFSLPSTPLVAVLALPEEGNLKTGIFSRGAFLSGAPSLVIEPLPSVRVHLVDPAGNPLPGRKVEVVLIPPWKDRVLRAAAPFLWPRSRTCPRGGWRLGIRETGKDGIVPLRRPYPDAVSVHVFGSVGEKSGVVIRKTKEDAVVVLDPGTRVEVRVEGVPWLVEDLRADLCSLEGNDKIRGTFVDGRFSWDRVPHGTWKVEISLGPRIEGAWVIPLAGGTVRVPGDGKPVFRKVSYTGPPLSSVGGMVKERSGKGKPADLTLQGPNGNWFLQVDSYGRVIPAKVPQGSYSLLWRQGYAFALFGKRVEVGEEGLVLNEVVHLCEKRVHFVRPEWSRKPPLKLKGNVLSPSGKTIWSGDIPFAGEWLTLKGEPGMVWVVVARGDQPGHKGWFKVKLGESGRHALDVKLSW